MPLFKEKKTEKYVKIKIFFQPTCPSGTGRKNNVSSFLYPITLLKYRVVTLVLDAGTQICCWIEEVRDSQIVIGNIFRQFRSVTFGKQKQGSPKSSVLGLQRKFIENQATRSSHPVSKELSEFDTNDVSPSFQNVLSRNWYFSFAQNLSKE